MLKRLTRVTSHSILRLLMFSVMLFLSVLYIHGFIGKYSEVSTETHSKPEQQKETAQQKSTDPLSAATSRESRQNRASTTEPAPIKYNLMAETYGRKWFEASLDVYLSSSDCTIEYANANRLQQDHPCVIHLIKNNYLHPPADKGLPYRMDHPEVIDPSNGQSKAILKILQNKTNGFFIECGGFDGESLSNTLYMERSLGWSGLLIEADKQSFSRLMTRNRKAYAAPVCLSTKLYPMQVIYSHNSNYSMLSSILEKNDKQQPTSQMNTRKGNVGNTDSEEIYKVQCFPLYSILLAIGKTQIDFFGLDVEGSEYKILKTIPWHNVDVKTLSVEWEHTPEGKNAMNQLMESNKFIKFGLIDLAFARDVVYVQDFLEDYRLYEDSLEE